MPLYFAYGANMDAGAMAARCPRSTLIGQGRLNRHRFIIMREGYASVVRDPTSTVWGVLWDLALADVPALDRYEGVAALAGPELKSEVTLMEIETDAAPTPAPAARVHVTEATTPAD